MTTVYVLFEEQEMKGVFASLDKALSHREKLSYRGLIVHCELGSFIHNAASVDTNVLFPGKEPMLKKGFNRKNVNMDEYHPKMQKEIEELFNLWDEE